MNDRAGVSERGGKGGHVEVWGGVQQESDWKEEEGRA